MAIYKEWKFVDELLLKLRYSKIIRYVPKDSVVIDFGCGLEAVFLKKVSPIIQSGIGIDLQARDYIEHNVRVIEGDLEKHVPLENESADVVTALAILEHVHNPTALLKEAYRILKPGGRLIMTVPTWFQKPIVEFLAFRLHVINEEAIADHKRYYWKKELEPLIIAAGFRKEDVTVKYFELGINNFVLAKK